MRSRRGRGGADLALFHDFAPPPTGGGHQFLRALVAEFERRGLTVELDTISRGTTVCLAQLVQLRLPPPPPIRARRRPLRPPRRRPDRDVSRFRRRHRRAHRRDQRRARGRDDRPVALQPRRAPRSRHRARGAASDLEHGRPVDLPPTRRARAARGQARPRHRVELVGQPQQGRGRPRVARPPSRPRALRADVRRSYGRGLRARPCARPDRDGAARGGAAAERRLSRAEPQRSVLQRAPRGTRKRAARGLSQERGPSRARR